MRNLGGILLLAGVFGFFYCSAQLSHLEPVPDGKRIVESLQYPAGRFEVGRYAAAMAAAVGVILAMFPKGR
jgi:hypothetical protein